MVVWNRLFTTLRKNTSANAVAFVRFVPSSTSVVGNRVLRFRLAVSEFLAIQPVRLFSNAKRELERKLTRTHSITRVSLYCAPLKKMCSAIAVSGTIVESSLCMHCAKNIIQNVRDPEFSYGHHRAIIFVKHRRRFFPIFFHSIYFLCGASHISKKIKRVAISLKMSRVFIKL